VNAVRANRQHARRLTKAKGQWRESRLTSASQQRSSNSAAGVYPETPLPMSQPRRSAQAALERAATSLATVSRSARKLDAKSEARAQQRWPLRR